MADNVAITAGTGTTIAADDIGAGVLAQRVKPVWGPDGTGNDIDVATGKPLPVQVRSATGLIPIGEPTDAKSTATDTTSVSLIAVSKQISASAQTIATNSGAALAAGTAVIGKVGVDQTTDGTTNAVRLLAETTKVIGTVNISASQTVGITNTPLTNFGAGEYETVAASATDQILGATGGVGDYLSGLLITPTTTAAGSVSIKDGNGSAIPIFNTGTLSNLVPFFVPLGMITVNATTPGWKVTTGANVTVIGVGNFT